MGAYCYLGEKVKFQNESAAAAVSARIVKWPLGVGRGSGKFLESFFIFLKTDAYHSGSQLPRGHTQHKILCTAKLTPIILVSNCKEYQFSI